MALHFVATSILTSEDGIEFGKETPLETDEARKARLDTEQATKKPLYMQLAEQKDKKQEEYDAMTKLIFAPPKALDEEDVAYFNQLESTKAIAMDARIGREEKAINEFREAARSKDHTAIKFASMPPKPSSSASTLASLPVMNVKRKVSVSSDKRGESKYMSSSSKACDTQDQKKVKTAETSDNKLNDTKVTSKARTEGGTKASGGLSALVGGYGSGDSDSD